MLWDVEESPSGSSGFLRIFWGFLRMLWDVEGILWDPSGFSRVFKDFSDAL